MGDGPESKGLPEGFKSPSAEAMSKVLRLSRVARFKQRKELMASIEPKVKKAKEMDEKKAEKDLQLGLALAEPPDSTQEKGSNTLNKEEHRAYILIIDEVLQGSETKEDEQEIDRSEISEIIFKNPQVFQAHYDQWKEDYKAKEKDQKFTAKYPTLDDYVKERGKAFIESRKKDTIAARVVKARKRSTDKADTGITVEELEKSADAQKVQMYLDKKQNYEELLTYHDLADESKKNAIYNKFIQNCGLQDLDPVEAKKMFEGIVVDIVAFDTADKRYDWAYATAMKMVDYSEEHGVPIDPDKWNEEIEKAIYQNAKGDLKEAIEKAEAQAVAPFSDNIDYSKPLERPQDVANLAGVIIVGRGSSDDNTYIVRYPNSSVVTRMKIIKKPGDKNYDNATFAVYDPHPDAGKNNWTDIQKKQDLRSGFNKVFLGSLMYTDAVKKKGAIPNEEANRFFDSDAVAGAASVLFNGKSLGEIFITSQRRLMFENLLAILMKPDNGKTKYGDKQAFAVRLKVMQDVFRYPNKVEELRRILLKPDAGNIHTISTIVAVVDQDQKEMEPQKK